MKYLAFILIVLISFGAKGQIRYPTGFPTQMNTGWNKWGYAMSDSGLIVANRDTNWLAKYSGTIVFKPSNKKFYWFDSTNLTWNAFATAIDTTPLHNQIILKLNIADTTNKWWGVGKRWVDTVYRKNDSTIGFTINNESEQTFQILGRSASGGGAGTVTSVALSFPSAFSVAGSPITTSGTFNVTTTGTSLDYIKGNGTIGVADTGMIPNFYLKVRSLLSGTSPIAYNSTTGAISIPYGNTTGTRGAVSFSNSDFIDNGAGLISLRNPAAFPGVDSIWRTPGVDSIYFTINSVQHTILDSLGATVTADNGLTKTGNNIQWGGTLIQDATVDGAASYISTFTSSGGLTARVFNTGSGNAFYANTSGTGTALTAQSTTGKGILASSSTQFGISTSSTSNIGLYSGTTSGVAAGAFETNPSSTNTTATILQLKRYTSGTAANNIAGAIEFITEPSTGTVDVTTGYIVSKLTDATFATRTSSMEFHTTNNTVTAVKAILSGPGLWNWPGYPASTAQTDTTTYKPVAIDGSGNVVKMIGWSGSGGGGATFPDGLLAATSNTPRVANDSDIVNSLNQYPELHNSMLFRQDVDSVIYVGDSYTVGTQASNVNLRFSSLLSARMGAIQVNLGQAGRTVSKRSPVDPFGAVNLIDMLSTIPHKSFKIKLLIIALGLNDVGMGNAPNYTTTNFKTDYDSAMNYITNTLGYTGQDILILPPWYIGYAGYLWYNGANGGNGIPTVARHLQFVDATQQTATKWRTMYFDMYQDFKRYDTAMIGFDALHPNDTGYQFIARDIDQYVNSVGNLVIGDYNATATATPTFIDLGARYSNSVGDASKLKLYLYHDFASPSVNFGLSVAAQTFGFHAGGPSTFFRFYQNGNTSEIMRLGPEGMLVGHNTSTSGSATPVYLDLGGTFGTTLGDTTNMKFRLYDVLSNGANGMNITSNDGGSTAHFEYLAAYNVVHDWYIGPTLTGTMNRTNFLIPNLKIRAAADSVGTATGGFVFRDAATGDWKITHPLNTLYTANDSLYGDRTVFGDGHGLTLGSGGSPLTALSITSSGRVSLFSGITYDVDANNIDADYTVASNTIIAEISDVLSTGRTLTLPSAVINGQSVTLLMRFSSGTNKYSLSAAVTDNATGSTFTTLDWGKTYDFMVDQSLAWRLIRKY